MSTQLEGIEMDIIEKVGMREFRANLQEYLMKTSPIAVTRHGETIGFYIPARHHHDKAELDALKEAALNLEKLLLSSGVTEEELFEDFRDLRESKNK
jgi:hypothetical protein